MPGPFIFVATNKVREGRLEGEKQRVPGWIEFIHSNEPRLIAFHEYLSEDGTEVEYVQVHPDTDSFENHRSTSSGSVELVRSLGAAAVIDYTAEDFTRRAESTT
jgi:hypothetical protein